ncbi:hypothetical protein CJ030_MR0G006614 [Morella rubra]|uniref:Uncharacterized protein n=1 Tax=Morella rubra TaxID=262757 RepID=A0A6A1UJU5_9ROSI|nr:hypothetical protein CJ030_MR0G006614 [Morella rubra]
MGNELVWGSSNPPSPNPTQHEYSSYPYHDASSELTPSDDESKDDSDYDLLNSGVRVIDNSIRRRRQKLPMWPVGLPGADYIKQVINMDSETNCEWQFRMGQEAFELLARPQQEFIWVDEVDGLRYGRMGHGRHQTVGHRGIGKW